MKTFSTADYAPQLRTLEERGVVVMHNISRFSAYHTDIVCTNMTLMVNERGSARALYDMQELSHNLHEVACIMPGHILHPIESSDDYLVTIVVLSQKIVDDLPFHTFSHDYEKFNLTPISPLTATQAERMMAITEQLEFVANQTETDLPHRHNMLLAILALGYEYLNSFRREMDKQWSQNRHVVLYSRFCELVVTHYTESREVKYYADLLHLHPKYFSKVIRSVTQGMSPADWIAQYVAAQAKRLIDTQQLTVKETAYRLGFDESASFCRFFKRATGMTPQQYRKRNEH